MCTRGLRSKNVIECVGEEEPTKMIPKHLHAKTPYELQKGFFFVF